MRVMLEAFGIDKKNRGREKGLSLEKVPRISMDAWCRRYRHLVDVCDWLLG